MEYLDAAPPCFMDDLLDFSLDIGEEEDADEKHKNGPRRPFSLIPCRDPQNPDANSLSFPEFVEEELEWISNKDAFPMVESFVDIMASNNSNPSIASTNHQSPVSVLENSSSSINSNASNKSGGTIVSLSSSLKVPVRARSKRRRKRRNETLVRQWQRWCPENGKTTSKQGTAAKASSSTLGRKCQHCLAEKTPQWRAGPLGPKTLCNACGVRYKSGRLVPEYRPASSPTFSVVLHSNSHRKIIEMRRKKQLTEAGLKPVETGQVSGDVSLSV
ncbi:hypothetical protein Nepgr_010099 [Nepenthes gracilis]|uniref:GATA-type domain-containing protein n=1 Tax=Nepenthes gracilis TaxID=150966 RepID=A0AAD3SCA9_NEPGR|nr:hypothetical protein Nepgr_010099 [Nepenthes gracilis]